MFDFLIEGSAVFAARNRQRNDFRRLGKIADSRKAIVKGFPLSVDLDVITADIQTMRISNDTQAFIEILKNPRWRHLNAFVIEYDFHARKLQVAQDLDHVRQWNVRETTSRCSNKHDV